MATSVSDLLTELKQRRDDLVHDREVHTQDVVTATRELGKQQAALDGVTARQQVIEAEVEATARLETELTEAKKAISDVKTSGEDELRKARDEHASLTSRVELELTEARRKALSDGINKIEAAIDAANSAAQAADANLAAAQVALATTQREANAAAKVHDELVLRLKTLPQRVEAARARVEALRAAAVSMADAGKMSEAFVRARDLGTAIEQLRKAVDEVADEGLGSDIPDLWQKKLSKSADLVTTQAKVEPLQLEATAAREARDTLVAAREEHILKIVNDPPPAPGAATSADDESSAVVETVPLDGSDERTTTVDHGA